MVVGCSVTRNCPIRARAPGPDGKICIKKHAQRQRDLSMRIRRTTIRIAGARTYPKLAEQVHGSRPCLERVQILTTPLRPYHCLRILFLMVLMSKCSDSLNCGPSLSQKSRVGHAGLPCWPGGRGGRPAVVPVVQSPEAAALSGP